MKTKGPSLKTQAEMAAGAERVRIGNMIERVALIEGDLRRRFPKLDLEATVYADGLVRVQLYRGKPFSVVEDTLMDIFKTFPSDRIIAELMLRS